MMNKELLNMMPLCNILEDPVFDEMYAYKGLVLLGSILLLPITFPLYLIGRMM